MVGPASKLFEIGYLNNVYFILEKLRLVLVSRGLVVGLCSEAYVIRNHHFGLIWCDLIRGLFDEHCLKVITFESRQDLRCPKNTFKDSETINWERTNWMGSKEWDWLWVYEV